MKRRSAPATRAAAPLYALLSPLRHYTEHHELLLAMTVEYAEYLAANVLNEQQLVCSDHSLSTFAQANIHVGQLPLSE
jgi:hypothetical protein